MSLLSRLLGGGRSKAYSRGIALLEAGDFEAALDHLRSAALGRDDSPSTSLASFHFRQALIQAGRRHLRSDRKDLAIPYFSEAVQLWDRYPDLHCLYGSALGSAGRWDSALAEARDALRLNPDYCEARLLEALALQQLGRPREASASLASLVESGRRVEHWLVNHFSELPSIAVDALPTDMGELLNRALSGRSEKEEVTAAVALCRAGRWPEGLERFQALVRKRPRYPDYRTRLAAALFQVGRNDEALTEAEAALALNEDYRTAQDLKGLVLADAGRLHEARDYLRQVDEPERTGRDTNEHEELFGTYLRAVLALLCGDLNTVGQILGRWQDLDRHFARAELLLAAADDLLGREEACSRRLAALTSQWPAEPVYAFLLSGHHLRSGRQREAGAALHGWPRSGSVPDARPLYLSGMLDLTRGLAPTPPADDGIGTGDAPPGDDAEPHVGPDAWRMLAARTALMQGEVDRCWSLCDELVETGPVTERLGQLQCEAALAGSASPPQWRPQLVIPDSEVALLALLLMRRGEGAAAEELSAGWRRLQPERPDGWWLSARFWLAPVRGWIA